MDSKQILVVDDEKNIRFTLKEALTAEGGKIDSAMNGEEALEKMQEKDYDLVLLDLKMPGMDGIDVLHRISEHYPGVKVIILTAHGTIDIAVEAMKLGAVDFIQKPFAPAEIRELVNNVLKRTEIKHDEIDSYENSIEMAKHMISERKFSDSIEYLKKAISFDASRPEAFNLMGAVNEIGGNRPDAMKYYLAALSLDATYEPARKNLYRSGEWQDHTQKVSGDVIDLGDEQDIADNDSGDTVENVKE